MRRGDVVTVTLAGDYGKPRPGLVVQSDAAAELPSVVVCPFTSDLQAEQPSLRILVDPAPTNGLRRASQVMVDKITAVPRGRIGGVIGRLDDQNMIRIDRALALLLGIV